MSNMYKILIVEDDMVIAESLKKHLCCWGLNAESVTDFKEVISTFVQYEPHLVLLDINLPFFNGYHWCTEIRKISKTPIVFLSSASDNMNIVMAMNMGADDFIPKPFDLNVVTAKIQALLRRSYSFQGAVNAITHKGAMLNLNDAAITYNDKKLELTRNEFKIIQILMENIGKVVSRDSIMTRLWESDSYIDDNTLTVNVTRLRKKLEEMGMENFILTKKGIGYMVE